MTTDSNISVDEYTDLLGQDCFHFCVTTDLGYKRLVRGFGSATNRDLALLKALSELAERSVYFDLNRKQLATNSNGFACHETQMLAMEQASLELYERDVVVTHWIGRRPPLWLTLNDLPLASQILVTNINQRIRPLNLYMQFGLWAEIGDIAVIIAALRSYDDHIGFAFASCANTSYDEAVKSLILTQRRAITMILSRSRSGKLLFPDLDSSQIETPQDHRDYYLNPIHLNETSWFFDQGSSTSIEPVDVQFELYSPIVKLPISAVVARAKSNELQNYFVGLTSERNINSNRFNALNFKIENLNTPHPLA